MATKSLVVSPTLVADAASMLVRAWACCGAVSVCEASTWGSPQRLTHLRVQAHHHQQKGASPHAQVQEEATAFLLAFVFAITGILGIANAPAAQASTSTSYLERVYARNPFTFSWSDSAPRRNDGLVGYWSQGSVPYEGKCYSYDPNLCVNLQDSWASLHYRRDLFDDVPDTDMANSPKMFQAMLNRWRELGYGSGSYLALDGHMVPNTTAMIQRFQTWWFGTSTPDGMIGQSTWEALVYWLGYDNVG